MDDLLHCGDSPVFAWICVTWRKNKKSDLEPERAIASIVEGNPKKPTCTDEGYKIPKPHFIPADDHSLLLGGV
jgi:hypothetical protein